MNICRICNKECDSIIKLSKHITNNHKIKIKDYYDSYIKQPDEGACKYCNNPTRFCGIDGYKLLCISSDCRSKAAKDRRKSMREDVEKQRKFAEKVKQNQTEIWKKRKETGEDKKIFEKTGKTTSDNCSNMTIEERREKFGWINKLSQEQRQQKIDTLLKTGAHLWWKTSTTEQRKRCVSKRTATMIQSNIELVELVKSNSGNWVLYREVVDRLSNASYFINKDIIDPDGIRGKEWHLDHKYSVKAGFINNVDPRIIANIHNLQLIKGSENSKKGMRCSITLEELMESINGIKI